MYWGEVNEYDQSWRDYARRNPNVDIKFFKFEDFLKNKVFGFLMLNFRSIGLFNAPRSHLKFSIIENRSLETKILELAKFIGFKEPNVEEIIKNSSLEATIERRKAKCEAAGYPFYEIICYRKVCQNSNQGVVQN